MRFTLLLGRRAPSFCPVLQGRSHRLPSHLSSPHPLSTGLKNSGCEKVLLKIPAIRREKEVNVGRNGVGTSPPYMGMAGAWQRPPRKVRRPRDDFGRSEAIEQANLHV